jgi:hypothetical protein
VKNEKAHASRALFSWEIVMLRRLMLLAFAFSFPAHGVGPDPGQDWRSAETAHFRINYVASQRAQAEHAAGIAESAYARLTGQLHWQPAGKTEVLLLDAFDLSNGYSTPLPFNETTLYLVPPDEGELLENSDWLDLLITHELTHTVHLDKVNGMPDALRHVFGREPVLFPNLFEPLWAIEGIATYNESRPDKGQGRLRGPTFEAWLRVERERGFMSLDEINSDGRSLPTSKQYLYGAYFYEFLTRKYGRDAAYLYVQNYSKNILPRVESNPEFLTGKTMDLLWEDFLADLGRQVDERSAPIRARPREDGTLLLPAQYSISSLAAVDDGVLAVVNDGVLGTQLLHIDTAGTTRPLAELRQNAHMDVNSLGDVLIAQPNICDNYNFYYDLYLWDRHGMKRLTQCQRYRRAVWAGRQVAALRYSGGRASLDILQMRGEGLQKMRPLYEAPDGIVAIDLAANADGSRVALAVKQRDSWQVLEFDPSTGDSNILFAYDAPLHGLRYARDGRSLEFIAVHDGVYNLWRYTAPSSQLIQLSHTYTSVTLHSGVADDRSVVLGVMGAGGTELRRLTEVADMATIPVAGGSALQAAPATQGVMLGKEEDYLALRSVYPRAWLPLWIVDRGLQAYGVSTFGSDVMGWHSYTLNAMWETTQGEPVGSLSYSYLDRHFFSITRNLWARQWPAGGATIYDRTTDAQWISMQPWLKSERRIYLGVGAAQQSTDRVYPNGLTTQPQMERVAATFLKYDTRESNWYATSYNRGALGTLLFESYRPFKDYYDGNVVRADALGLWPWGDSVFGLRWGEARAYGHTEPFQLGGAFEYGTSSSVPVLNQRNLPLRGYAGSEPQLVGENVRSVSVEWQAPLADIDRHWMAPPVGINRLSGKVFMDAASVWNRGAAPSSPYRGVGVELYGEIKFLYQLMLPMRLGYARGLDLNAGNRVYLQAGQTF